MGSDLHQAAHADAQILPADSARGHGTPQGKVSYAHPLASRFEGKKLRAEHTGVWTQCASSTKTAGATHPASSELGALGEGPARQAQLPGARCMTSPPASGNRGCSPQAGG